MWHSSYTTQAPSWSLSSQTTSSTSSSLLMGSSYSTAGSNKILIVNTLIDYSSDSKPSASMPSPSCSRVILVIWSFWVSPPSIDTFSTANHTACQ